MSFFGRTRITWWEWDGHRSGGGALRWRVQCIPHSRQRK